MNLVQKLKCTIKNASEMEAYYQNLSVSSLKVKQRNLRSNYIALTLSWCTSLFVVLFATKTEPELVFLFSIVVVSLLLVSVQDYRKQRQLIREALNRKA